MGRSVSSCSVVRPVPVPRETHARNLRPVTTAADWPRAFAVGAASAAPPTAAAFWRRRRRENLVISSFHRKHPDRAALWHLRIFPREDAVQLRLHACGVDAPARLHRDVLLAVEHERGWLSDDAGA